MILSKKRSAMAVDRRYGRRSMTGLTIAGRTFGSRLLVGTGKRGPITAALQSAFFGLFTGETADEWGWLDVVDMAQARIAVVQ